MIKIKKPTATQRKILQTAAGIADHKPFGRSQFGGWSSAYVVCRKNGWTDNQGKITGENVPRIFIHWVTDSEGALRIRKWSQGPHEGAVEYAATPEVDQSGLKAMFDAVPIPAPVHHLRGDE